MSEEGETDLRRSPGNLSPGVVAAQSFAGVVHGNMRSRFGQYPQIRRGATISYHFATAGRRGYRALGAASVGAVQADPARCPGHQPTSVASHGPMARRKQFGRYRGALETESKRGCQAPGGGDAQRLLLAGSRQGCWRRQEPEVICERSGFTDRARQPGLIHRRQRKAWSVKRCGRGPLGRPNSMRKSPVGVISQIPRSVNHC